MLPQPRLLLLRLNLAKAYQLGANETRLPSVVSHQCPAPPENCAERIPSRQGSEGIACPSYPVQKLAEICRFPGGRELRDFLRPASYPRAGLRPCKERFRHLST